MGFCLLQSMGKNLGKVKSKNLRSKHNHRPLAHAKQSAADAFKTASIRAIQKSSEATGDSICNKTAEKDAGVSRSSSKNSSEAVESETRNTGFYREILKERHIFPEKRLKIIDDLRLL